MMMANPIGEMLDIDITEIFLHDDEEEKWNDLNSDED